MSKKQAATSHETDRAKDALDEHIRVTQESIRSLNGLSAKQVERLIRFVEKSSHKLQARLAGKGAPFETGGA
jgi:hypothetical protein